MGIIKDNILVEGMSGKLGPIMLRTYNKKTYFSSLPSKPTKESEQQRSNREKFQLATKFAKAMMQKPERKEYYQRKAKKLKLPNPYTAAITDYMRKPEIRHVDVSEYSGKAGDVIRIDATKKNFPADRVEVTIKDADKQVIEKGSATLNAIGYWAYKTSLTLSNKGCYITVSAETASGVKTEKEIYKE